jgi:hypothetical protein
MASQLLLSLENLKHLDLGKAALTFDDCLRRAVRDCLERPGDKRDRRVSMVLTLVPSANIQGESITCEGAKGKFLIQVKIPNYETAEVDFGVRNTGALIFSPANPRDHRQESLPLEADYDADSQA